LVWGAEDSRAALPSAATHRQPGLDAGSPVQTKIALFRSLFRGREDVYARRFKNPKTGKAGYAPTFDEAIVAVCWLMA
jgi:hypothetical protein